MGQSCTGCPLRVGSAVERMGEQGDRSEANGTQDRKAAEAREHLPLHGPGPHKPSGSGGTGARREVG